MNEQAGNPARGAMMGGVLSVVLWAALIWGIVAMTSGCALFDSHVKQMDLLRGMASDVTARLQDGSFGQVSASGQALNPGIALEAAVVYRVTGRYDGLAGQFSIAAHGVLGDRQFSPEILAIINDSSMSREARVQALFALVNALIDKAKPAPEPTP